MDFHTYLLNNDFIYRSNYIRERVRQDSVSLDRDPISRAGNAMAAALVNIGPVNLARHQSDYEEKAGRILEEFSSITGVSLSVLESLRIRHRSDETFFNALDAIRDLNTTQNLHEELLEVSLPKHTWKEIGF